MFSSSAQHASYTVSQCSTVVRNTVVRAMMEVNGKHLILGTPRPLISHAIDMKFDTNDYVGGVTPYAKYLKNRPPQGSPGKGVKYGVQGFLFFIFF